MATKKSNKIDPMIKRITTWVNKNKDTKWIAQKLNISSYKVGAVRRSLAKQS